MKSNTHKATIDTNERLAHGYIAHNFPEEVAFIFISESLLCAAFIPYRDTKIILFIYLLESLLFSIHFLISLVRYSPLPQSLTYSLTLPRSEVNAQIIKISNEKKKTKKKRKKLSQRSDAMKGATVLLIALQQTRRMIWMNVSEHKKREEERFNRN